MRRRRSGRPLAALAAAGLLALGAVDVASASVHLPWIPGYDGATSTRSLRTAYLTRDGSDAFIVVKDGPVLTAAAPETNTGGNTRAVVWPSRSVVARDAQTCATWSSESDDFIQEGLALRIRHHDGVTTAITVTKNIYYGAHWMFNVHAWDSSSASPFTQLGQWDLSPVILDHGGQYQPMPWRVCFRAVGSTVGMKIWWPAQMSEPSWSDPDYARTMTIPAEYTWRGHAGWYVGHLRPGLGTSYDGLRTWFSLVPTLGG
ncbi:hypothetical protein [Nocardioides cynanchi]|uniref:hypothetical protein n=1 Tax=Nocardioides cynanchi TaxID=2558918 RepID=UPI0012450675|nr:hypothetical protein [Nocardioides cynanchi]